MGVRMDIVEVNGRTFESVKIVGMVPEPIEENDFNIYVRWEDNGTIRADRSDTDRMIVAAHVGKGGKGGAFAQLMENLATYYGVPVEVACDPGVSGGQSGKMVGTYLPREVTTNMVAAPIVALDAVETRADEAIGHVKANGRVFLAEVHNFGGSDAFALAAELGWLTLVEDGDMSRYVPTRRTADGVIITQGLPVWDYNVEVGTVDLTQISSDGWFHVLDPTGKRQSLMNAERVATRHPFSRALASDVLAAMAKPATVEIHTFDGTVITGDDVKSRIREAFKPAEPIPANPEPFTDRDMRDQIVAYLGSDVDAYYVDGIVDHLIRTHNGAINIDDVDAGSWHGTVALFHKPTEVEVWSGTGTLVKPSIRTALGRRKRKATKKARRMVKGGF